jgi:hypothetical protein
MLCKLFLLASLDKGEILYEQEAKIDNYIYWSAVIC